jgi:Zn finger protein HypA/HybF involved in hydrogenase expression
MNNVNMIDDLEEIRWQKWAKDIGVKPVFIFKAALSFIEEKELISEFEIFVKGIMKALPKSQQYTASFRCNVCEHMWRLELRSPIYQGIECPKCESKETVIIKEC